MANAREVIAQADAARDDVTVLSLFSDWLKAHEGATFLEVRFGADRWDVPKVVRDQFAAALRSLVTGTLEKRMADASSLDARILAADV